MATDGDLDDLDRQILRELSADGRVGPSDIAEAVGVATSTATKRLQRLDDDGVVESYRATIDYQRLGYEVTAIFRLNVDGAGRATLVAELQDSGRMVAVYEVTGSYDVVAVGKFTDTDALNAQIKWLLTHENVRTATTNVVLDTVCEGEIPPIPDGE